MEPLTILQSVIPDRQRDVAAARLPSMQPIDPGPWITVDSAYGAQLAEKARLLAEIPDRVLHCLAGTEAALAELLTVVLAQIAMSPDFAFVGDGIRCPDGRIVDPDPKRPLWTLSQLVQEDLCLLEKRGAEHVMTAALLCFPAGWTLAEKIGRPLTAIHTPVPVYDVGIAARVQRFFDGVQAGRPLWRANLLRYDDPKLYQPHFEAAPRPVGTANSPFERSERQSVLRLPGTGAVVFAIHTTVVRRPRD